MLNDVRPYLVPTSGAEVWDRWRVLQDGAWNVLPARIDDWDTDSDLRLRRQVSIPHGRLVAEAGLPNDAPLSVTTSWTSSATGMTERAARATFGSSGEMLIDIVLPAGRIGGALTIVTTLTLAVDLPHATPGVASQAGSVLFADEHSVSLQSMPMFPVAVTDFAATRFDADSSWRLQTSTSLDLPFLGDFLLLLNSRDIELVTAVTKGVRDRRQELLMDQLEEDLAALMLELALEMKEELMSQEWPDDSVGDVLGRLLPQASARGLRQPPTGPEALAAYRADVRGVVRAAGRGRAFS